MASDKLWAGRSDKATDPVADDFNSSLHFDCRMYRCDIEGSIAHAEMLARQGIISDADCAAITAGLAGIAADIESGKLAFTDGEDIHMFIESELTARIGDAGKRLHTARSRNDQVALDLRMYLRGECDSIGKKIAGLGLALCGVAEEHAGTIMPGYTHLQRAQPVTFGHHLLAYAMMLCRDYGRLGDAAARMNKSPLGCCALAGTTYPIDREFTADKLGFDGICLNSIDGVSDRDFACEIASALSICMMHLSRLAEELILWSSWEFSFIELDDAYTTGSSIMPQKKNSDMAELVRGKTGRVYGDLTALLTALKGLPLAYNKDMQEDKEAIFDAVDTAAKCLDIMIPMIATMKVKKENMYRAAGRGFINATDCADYLVGRGMPFREAYKLTGELVAFCVDNGYVLDDLPLEVYKQKSDLFDEGVYDAVKLENCVARRTSAGGSSPASIAAQIAYVKSVLEK